MAPQNATVTQTLRSRHGDIVLFKSGDHIGSKEARIRGNEAERQAGNGEHHVFEVLGKTFADRYIAEWFNPTKLYANDEGKNKSYCKTGD